MFMVYGNTRKWSVELDLSEAISDKVWRITLLASTEISLYMHFAKIDDCSIEDCEEDNLISDQSDYEAEVSASELCVEDQLFGAPGHGFLRVQGE